ncbi:MAG: type II secretion system protein [Pirellulaceae bacterium]
MTFTIPHLGRRQAGFTLLELMLVLAILVVIGGIAAPRLGGMFERRKLVGSAETLRLQWEEARLLAMRTGQSQVFTCELGTGGFRIKPLVLQSDAVNVGEGATLATMTGLVETENYGMGNVAVAVDPQAVEYDQQLEESVVFLGCVVAGDMRAYTTAQESQTTGFGDVNTQTVSQSVIFYPDGSTSTAEVQIQNKRGEVRAVQIRGLTGNSRIVEVLNVAEGQEQS